MQGEFNSFLLIPFLLGTATAGIVSLTWQTCTLLCLLIERARDKLKRVVESLYVATGSRSLDSLYPKVAGAFSFGGACTSEVCIFSVRGYDAYMDALLLVAMISHCFIILECLSTH